MSAGLFSGAPHGWCGLTWPRAAGGGAMSNVPGPLSASHITSAHGILEFLPGSLFQKQIYRIKDLPLWQSGSFLEDVVSGVGQELCGLCMWPQTIFPDWWACGRSSARANAFSVTRTLEFNFWHSLWILRNFFAEWVRVKIRILNE